MLWLNSKYWKYSVTNIKRAARRIVKMETRQNHAFTSGILSIISGAIGILYGLMFIGIGLVFLFMFNDMPGMSTADIEFSEPMAWIICAVYCFLGVIFFLMSILVIVGGSFALKKKYWGWALAGAICGAVVFLPLGIAAVVLVTLAKPEFDALKAQSQAIAQGNIPPPSAPAV
jgi:hypothetical protein